MSRSTHLIYKSRFRQNRLSAVIITLFLLFSITGAGTGSFGTDAVAQTRQISFSKAFAPGTIGPGSTTTLSFNIVNPDPTPVSNLVFTDTLPSGVYIATPANAMATCDSLLVAPDGGDTISFRQDRLGAYSGCVIMVDVTSSITGTHHNVSGDLTSDAGNHGNTTADLVVDANIPGFTKSFSPGTIPPGSVSTLVFTIDNTANGEAEEQMSFTDLLPVGMVVANPANASTDCSSGFFPPILTADPGTNLVSLLYGSVGASSSCNVTVDVTTSDFGVYINNSGELAGGAYPNIWTSGKATAVLDVPLKFLIKSFTDDPVAPGDTTTLEFTITNLDRSNTATDISFTDDLEATLTGLAVVAPLPSNPCGAGSQLTGTSTLTLTGGTLGPGASCTFSATLQVPLSTSSGTFINTTSVITAQAGGDVVVHDPATDRLFVEPAPVLTKAFVDNPVAAGGTVDLEFTITNSSPTASATNIAFEDVFFVGLPTASNIPAPGFCGAGATANFTPLFNPSGSDATPAKLAVSGASLAPGASCTFSITLDVATGTPNGTYPNTTSNITAMVDGQTVTGDPATDDLVVVAAPALYKSFTDDPVLPGSAVTLEFVLAHDEFAPADAANISFSDDLGATLSGLTATGLPQNDVCGAGSQITGTTDLSFTGGSLVPGASCAFSVTLQVTDTAIGGIYSNQTSNVAADVLGLAAMGNPAQDDLIVGGVLLTKSFTDDPVIPGDTVTLKFTVVNSSTIYTATSILFFDDLSVVLSGLAATDLPKNDVCGAGSSITTLGSSLFFQNGTLNPGTSCTFTTTLQVPGGAASNTYVNTTSGFQAVIDGSTVQLANAVGELIVSSNVLSLTKSFTDGPLIPGSTTTLEFSLTNLDLTRAVTDVTFTDDLDAALPDLVATGLPQNDVCGAGSQIAGADTLTFTGGSLGPGASCAFSVTLTVPETASSGTYNNTTSQVTGAVGGLGVTGDPARDDFVVNAIKFSKSFDSPAFVGGDTVLTFTVQNPNTSTSAINLAFLDDLDAMISGLEATDLPKSDVCGVDSQLMGTSSITLTNGNLAPETSCTFSVTLQIPAMASTGNYTNTTSDLTSSGLVLSTPAVDTLTLKTPPGFTLSAISGDTGEDGTQATFSLRLDVEPTGDVVVDVSSNDTGEGTISPASLTFDNGNWSVDQTVTVTGVDDAIVDGDQTFTVQNTINTTATTDTSGYAALDPVAVSVTNVDDDVAGINVAPTDLTISEPDGAATFTITLSSEPTATVTISMTSLDASACSVPASVGLDSGNWDSGVGVTVSAVDDAIVDGLQTCTVQTNASSGDPHYDGAAVDDVIVSVQDDDVAGVNVAPTNLTISEPDGAATFTITLSSEPTVTVTISMTSLDASECSVPASVGLDNGNWDSGVGVTVSAVDDAIADGLQTCTVQASASSGDSHYDGLAADDVTVSVQDDDGPGVLVTESGGSTQVTEGGATDSYELVLNSEPAAEVTVNVTTDGQTSVSPDTLIFATGDWDTPQTVTVTAVDDTLVEGLHSSTITHTASSADADYDGIAIAGVTASITDNDSEPAVVTVTFDREDYAVDESAGSATITVTLSAAAVTTVTVDYASSGGNATPGLGADYAAVSGTLEFAPDVVVQTFQVTVYDDTQIEMDETVGLTLNAPLNATLGSPANATLTILDNDGGPSDIYLPLTLKDDLRAPDLIVQQVIATGDDVQVIIKNQGNAPVTDEFWVQAYIDPDPAPTAVNQLWYELGDQGLFWGVISETLPLAPGAELTLAYDDAYYWPTVSRFDRALAPGTPVYAQVDTYDETTTYGAVLESHEILGGEYNNVAGPFESTTSAAIEQLKATVGRLRSALGNLSPLP